MDLSTAGGCEVAENNLSGRFVARKGRHDAVEAGFDGPTPRIRTAIFQCLLLEARVHAPRVRDVRHLQTLSLYRPLLACWAIGPSVFPWLSPRLPTRTLCPAKDVRGRGKNLSAWYQGSL